MDILVILIFVGLFATLGILLAGVFTMARGGEFNQKHSNKLMRMRVIAQFVTLALIALFAALSIGGK